jgi:hypothetical protein
VFIIIHKEPNDIIAKYLKVIYGNDVIQDEGPLSFIIKIESSIDICDESDVVVTETNYCCDALISCAIEIVLEIVLEFNISIIAVDL